jgi:hypothetical protein
MELTKKQKIGLCRLKTAYNAHKTYNRFCVPHAGRRYVFDKLVKFGLATREWQWLDSDHNFWDTKQDALDSEEHDQEGNYPRYYACYRITEKGLNHEQSNYNS